MKNPLMWKLLRKHVSKTQLIGFAVANLVGLTIVLLGIQFYADVRPVFSDEDSFIRKDYLVITKNIGNISMLKSAIGGTDMNAFSEEEIAELESQPWMRKVGRFTTSNYKIYGNISLGGRSLSLRTYIFFESVPDEFIDTKGIDWDFDPEHPVVPILLSRDYLSLYNFGFATSQGMPQLSEDMIGLPNIVGVGAGLHNLNKHIDNIRSFGQHIVVALNRYADDLDDEIDAVRDFCENKQVGFAVNNAYAEGGSGAIDLANEVVRTIEKRPSEKLQFTYNDGDSTTEKIEKVAKRIYGAAEVTYSIKARRMLKLVEKLGLSSYPVCIAKTQYSFSADPKAYGVARDFEFHIKDIVINMGAEMIVVIAGDIMRMPGLPKDPQANHIDYVNGHIEGLS